MTDAISLHDKTYIAFAEAAELIARDLPNISAEEMMDTFKEGLFRGDFECSAWDNRRALDNWLHVPYMPPPGEQAIVEGALGAAVPVMERRRYYAMNLTSILSVLICEEALPGSADTWDRHYDESQTEQGRHILCCGLAYVPFADYPAHGRALIGEIRISRKKLLPWLARRPNIIPDSLRALNRALDHDPQVKPDPPAGPTTPHAPRPRAANDNGDPLTDGAPPSGRPRKAGWDRIGELVREIHQADSEKLRKIIAYEAYAQALNEFPESDLPTMSSILRNMSRLLH
ncbi:hypothetical protein [Paremcibacter congregatus]|uniref:hypothetical protein n=1 Tax=Paremcibacter congregatus TaxID=2043170 RepID=UPI0030EEF63D